MHYTQLLAAAFVPVFWVLIRVARAVVLAVLLWLTRLLLPRAEYWLFRVRSRYAMGYFAG